MRKFSLVHGLVASLALLASVPAAEAFAAPMQSASQQQLRLSKGTWWGSPGDRVEIEVRDQLAIRKIAGTVVKLDTDKGIVTVQAEIDGKTVTRPMFASEILSMKTVGTGAVPETKPADPKTPAAKPVDTKPSTAPAKDSTGKKPDGLTMEPSSGKPSGKVDAQGFQLDEKGYRISPKKGVFVLPWKDAVGQTARHDEIEAVAKEADKWGPGQIIVLDIESPGGLVTEIFKISDTLREVKKRHRVVAWIKEAISAAAVTAMHCDEIYFRRVGALGAAMMIRGRDSVKGEPLELFKDEIAKVVEENGRPRSVFFAMVEADAILTYTKDPVTGKPTFHDRVTGAPGEVVLSNEKDNLVFNASNALDSGFSNGTADTPEELAPLLGLTEWYEVSDFGRKLAKSWQTLFADCEKDLELQMGRLNIPRAGGSVEQLSTQIQIAERVLQWSKRCPPCTEGKGIDSEELERQIKMMRKRLAEMRKAQNSNAG